jgi:hypothetical protein
VSTVQDSPQSSAQAAKVVAPINPRNEKNWNKIIKEAVTAVKEEEEEDDNGFV